MTSKSRVLHGLVVFGVTALLGAGSASAASLLESVDGPSGETCVQARAAIAKSFETDYADSHAVLLIQADEHVLVTTKTGEGVTRNSRFLLASITKSLHGAVASRLAVKKLLNFEDLVVSDLPPDLAFTRPASWSKLKIRHLLHHTSGIADYLDQAYDGFLRFPQSFLFLIGLLPRELEFEPDTMLKYSNTNYLILSLIMQKRAMLSDDELIRREVVQPLGLTDTGTLLLPDSNVFGGSNVAMSNLIGVGNAYSSAADLMKFLLAFDLTVYLPDANVTQIFSPDPACHGEGCDRYGLGFSLRQNALEGFTWALHRGNLAETSTVIAKVPDVGLDMVLLSDRGGVDNEVVARESLSRLIRAKCVRNHTLQ